MITLKETKTKTCSLDKFLISKCKDQPHLLKEFIKFLYTHHAYGVYVFNYIHASESWKRDNHHEGGYPHAFIIDAFLWDATPQYHSYWSSLHDEWCSQLTGLKKKKIISNSIWKTM